MGILGKVLGPLSGGLEEKLSEQLLFDKVIGFRGIKDGVGCSTLVHNVVCGLIDATKYNVCVVDTNLLYPTQEFLLGAQVDETTQPAKDIMDFAGDNLSQLAHRTKYSNVYLVSFRNRTIADMLSSKECQATMERLLDSLKDFFDIVIVDISHEPTWASTIAALKCNRIYTVVDPSVACISVLQKSLNALASFGVPLFKMHKVILNKNIADVNAGTAKALRSFGLDVIAEIPFGVEIARFGVTGQRIWGALSNRPAVTSFNQAVDRLLDDICESNETNTKMIRTEDVPMEQLETSALENPEFLDSQREKVATPKPPVSKPAPAPVQQEKKSGLGLGLGFGKKKPTTHAPNAPIAEKSEQNNASFVSPAVPNISSATNMPKPVPKPVQVPNNTPPAIDEDDEFDIFGDE